MAVGALVFAGLAVFDLLFYSAYTVPGSSMAPTIDRGAHVWARPVAGAEVKSGDIVLLQSPAQPNVPSVVAVIRVVAGAGQTVEVQDGHLVVDGAQAPEPYLESGMQTPPLTAMTVPRDTVFVLGDNRMDSIGSIQYGPVPVQNILQRVIRVDAPTGTSLILRGIAGFAVAVVAALISWWALRSRRSRLAEPRDRARSMGSTSG
ncbi:hypothetical protein LQK93_02279 [Terrabacter sp. BE26]